MAKQPRQRARRDERAANPPPIRLTKRDLAVIKAVYEYRILTTQQLKTLFFPSLHQAYARLAALYHHGFLARQFTGVHADKMNTPILYTLDRRGAELLRAELGLEVQWSREITRVGRPFLEHTRAINSVRVAVTVACGAPHYQLLAWHGESELKADYERVSVRTPSGRTSLVPVVPDSYFRLQTPRGVAHFFLELDRGTMTTQRFRTKVMAYQAYYQSGAFQRRYQARGLRILTVTTSQARAVNLKRATEAAGGAQRFWFALLEQITPHTVLTAPIWMVATKEALEALVPGA